MPALSFHREWLDRLLSGDKQQTTRPQNTRFGAGDIAHIYIEQRRRIQDKPLRCMTYAGIGMMYERGYPMIPEFHKALYHAHFLGVVEVAAVYDIHPIDMSGEELEAWAWADGFDSVAQADRWFAAQYDEEWRDRWWTVIGWQGWRERYFFAGEIVL